MSYRAPMAKIGASVVMLFLIVCGSAGVATAGVQTLIVWYPGETGTAVDAQPLLDQFAAHLGRLTPGTTWKMRYCPEEAEGLRFIRSQRPAFGIVSLAMYLHHRATVKMSPIASTLPLPQGKSTETLTFVEGPTDEPPKGRLLFTTQRYPTAWLLNVFPTLPAHARRATVQVTSDMRKTLQQVAEGSGHAAVLTAAEQVSFGALKGEWTRRLSATPSRPIPSPYVVQFGTQPLAERVQKALAAISRDPIAKALLEEMRLSGFAPLNAPH